ncbi:MAG TPA: response regulator [Geminicoccaceae bacterium]|nr:response regulator [Geminicoccaceae bacterium]
MQGASWAAGRWAEPRLASRWAVPGAIRAAPDQEGRPAAAATARRLLIVEDDWLIAAQIQACLESAGYEVVGHATDEWDALALAEQGRPDLVLMDIRLQGGGDGIAAAARIRDRLAIPTIYVSAHTDPATVDRARPSRPMGWVQKPFTDSELLEAVAGALAAP